MLLRDGLITHISTKISQTAYSTRGETEKQRYHTLDKKNSHWNVTTIWRRGPTDFKIKITTNKEKVRRREGKEERRAELNKNKELNKEK